MDDQRDYQEESANRLEVSEEFGREHAYEYALRFTDTTVALGYAQWVVLNFLDEMQHVSFNHGPYLTEYLDELRYPTTGFDGKWSLIEGPTIVELR